MKQEAYVTGNAARIPLTAEEAFVWTCARHRANPLAVAVPSDLQWDRVVALSILNRVPLLLHDVLEATGRLSFLPVGPRQQLNESLAPLRKNADLFSTFLTDYLQRAHRAGLETVPLKGIWLSICLYGRADFRPGVDVDLLVRQARVADCLAVLQAMGLDRCWSGLMHNKYYARHHLHQIACRQDIRLWVEVHWALDHPYTLLTTDMEGLMDRTSAGHLLGCPVRDPSLPDLLLSLTIHLIKHAVYLPSVLTRPDLARIILADGMLLYLLDIAELLKQHGDELDWSLTIELARSWGAGAMLGATLRACREFLGAPVSDTVLAALPVTPPPAFIRAAMNRVASHSVRVYQGGAGSRFWDFLLRMQESLILRPIRVLDAIVYCVPGAEYLRRRYQSDSALTALAHFGRAVLAYTRLIADTLYYTGERLCFARRGGRRLDG